MLQEISRENNIFQQKILTSVEISNMHNGNAAIFVTHWDCYRIWKHSVEVITKPRKYFWVKVLIMLWYPREKSDEHWYSKYSCLGRHNLEEKQFWKKQDPHSLLQKIVLSMFEWWQILFSSGKLTFRTSSSSSSDVFMHILLAFSQTLHLRICFSSDLLRKLLGLYLKLSTIKGLKHHLLWWTDGVVDGYIPWKLPSQTDWYLLRRTCFLALELHVVQEQADLGWTTKSHVGHVVVTLLCEVLNDEHGYLLGY